MDKPISEIDWSLMQAFLAVAESGSLSAAARSRRASQPTLGRQIKSIEQQLGVTLFHRKPRGFVLTETGAALVKPALDMRDAMNAIALTVAGEQEALKGTVRITASMMLSAHHLPALLQKIRTAEPEIQIELVASDESRNLLYREADIAIRMYRPTQLDLIAKHVGDVSLSVFAAKKYIATRGRPTLENLLEHDVIGYDANPAIIEGFKIFGIDVTRDFFPVRCDDQNAYWELVRSGCGIGFSQTSIGAADPLVERIDLDLDIPPLPMWLTAHEAMRQTPRIRRVWELLAAGLKPLAS